MNAATTAREQVSTVAAENDWTETGGATYTQLARGVDAIRVTFNPRGAIVTAGHTSDDKRGYRVDRPSVFAFSKGKRETVLGWLTAPAPAPAPAAVAAPARHLGVLAGLPAAEVPVACTCTARAAQDITGPCDACDRRITELLDAELN